jgi:PhoD-like phosphatase
MATMPTGLTRRDVLRWTGLGGAGLAVVGCGDNIESRPPSDSHAAAILEPDMDSFLVAVWALLARAVVVEVRAAAGGEVVFDTVAVLETWHTTIEVRGLAPDTTYVVTLQADDGVRLGPHRVRTLPRADAVRPVRLAVSADVDPYPEFISDLTDHLIVAEPDLYISLGDFPYTDNGPPAIDAMAYRERHAQTRTEPRVRRLLEATAIRAIYDDHEFRNDWDGMYMVTESARFAAAMLVWDEFFPLRAGTPSDVRYRSWRHGVNLECFMLDCRRHRSPNAAPDSATKTMLGAVQRQWLIDAVTRSTATFKIVFSSVPLDFGNGLDHWSGFRTERDGLLDALAGVSGLLFLSADQHWFAAHRHAHGIREFQVGPLARGLGTPTAEAPGVLFRASRFNAGLIDVDGSTLTVSGIGVGGEVFYKEMLHVADLTPSPAR